MKWIHVKDELPTLFQKDEEERSDDVLVFCEKYEIYDIAHLDAELGWLLHNDEYGEQEVTHWMRLPDGPRR